MTESRTLLTSNAIPLDRGFRLRLSFVNTKDDPQPVAVRYLIESPDGSVLDSYEEFNVPGNTTPSEFFTYVTNGQLVSATVTPVTDPIVFGELFCKIDLVRGQVVDGSSVIPLTAGYIDSSAALNYPLSPFADSYESNGATRLLLPTPPAAGAEISTTASDFLDYEILSGSFRLVTSAAVAVRTVTLTTTSASGVVSVVQARTTQLASQTRFYRLWTGPNLPTDVGSQIYLPVNNVGPWNELTFQTTTANIDVADQFSLINLNVRERIRKLT